MTDITGSSRHLDSPGHFAFTLLVVTLLGLAATARTASAQSAAAPTPTIEQLQDFPESDFLAGAARLRGDLRKFVRSRAAAGDGTIELVEHAFYAELPDLAITFLRRVVSRRPQDDERSLRTIEYNAGRFRLRHMRGQLPELRRLAAILRQRQRRLPREEAARLEWAWLGASEAIAGRQPISLVNEHKRAFIERWPGTEAATFRDIEVRTSSPVSRESYQYVERLARHHHSDVVRGKAYTQLAIVLQDQYVAIEGLPHGETGDPTERRLRALAVIRELQTANLPSPLRYGHGSLVSSAGSGLHRFIDGPAKLLAGYRDFVVSQVNEGWTTGWWLSASFKYGAVAALLGRLERDADRDAFFNALAASVSDAGPVRFLEAQYYAARAHRYTDSFSPVQSARARRLLESLSQSSSSPLARRALLQASELAYLDGDYQTAQRLYSRLLTLFPQDPYAWVASLRSAECTERLALLDLAADQYQKVAAQYPAIPIAKVLGFAHAARLRKTRGHRMEAIALYRSALAAFDDDYGESYTIGNWNARQAPWTVTRATLRRALSQLTR